MIHHLNFDISTKSFVVFFLTIGNVAINWWPLEKVDHAVVGLVHVLQAVLACLSIALAIRALRKTK